MAETKTKSKQEIYTEIINRLKEAGEPSRILDVLIHEHVVGLEMYESIVDRGGDPCIRYYPAVEVTYHRLPRYTYNIDDAARLVDDFCFSVDRNKDGSGAASVTPDFAGDMKYLCTAVAETPAIALCIAAIRSRSGV